MLALDRMVGWYAAQKPAWIHQKREKVQKRYTILIKYHADTLIRSGATDHFVPPVSRQSANIFKTRVINLSPPSDIGGESADESQFMV